jgi:hypothetical protein
MHIMFMAQCYAPEDVSAAVLITELAEDLVNRGHRAMVTGAPNILAGFSMVSNKIVKLNGGTASVIRT